MTGDALPEGFEGFEVTEPSEKVDAREAAARVVSGLVVGQTVRVGSGRWTVWKSIGVTKYVTRAGSKGRKLYRLDVVGLEPLVVSVREVFGTTDLGVVAEGVLVV